MFAIRRQLPTLLRPATTHLPPLHTRPNSHLTTHPTRPVTKSTENQSIVSHDQATVDAHRSSGLTTSHPSPEIISADVLSDAPCEWGETGGAGWGGLLIHVFTAVGSPGTTSFYLFIPLLFLSPLFSPLSSSFFLFLSLLLLVHLFLCYISSSSPDRLPLSLASSSPSLTLTLPAPLPP